MSDLVSLIRILSKDGLSDLIPKKENDISFANYFLENINTTGKKITIYNKLLYLYDSKNYSFIYSNLGPYSPDITDEIIELRKFIPMNEKVLNGSNNYDNIKNFLSDFKKSVREINEKITFDLLIELSIYKWLRRHESEKTKINSKYFFVENY